MIFRKLFPLLLCCTLLCACGAQEQAEPTQPSDSAQQWAHDSRAPDISYPVQRLMIDGAGIGAFVIVSRGGTYSTAAGIVLTGLAQACGYTLEIQSPEQAREQPHAIIFCSSGLRRSGEYQAGEGQYGIYSDGADVYICGGDEQMEAYAAKQFLYRVLGYNTKTKVAAQTQLQLSELSHTGEKQPLQIGGEEEYFAISTPVAQISGPFPDECTYNTLQGVCTDGVYVYVFLADKASELGGCALMKYRADDWSLVGSTYNLQVGHGNSAVYLPRQNQIMVVDYTSSMQVHYVDVDTLQIVQSRMLPFECYCVAYNPAADEYVFGVKAAKKFYVLDGELNVLRMKEVEGSSGDQNVFCDENYIYMVYDTPNQYIVYDWQCNYVNTIYLDTALEIESVFCIDGVYYSAYYIRPGAGGEIYRTEIF